MKSHIIRQSDGFFYRACLKIGLGRIIRVNFNANYLKRW